jgi:hypothetical protein
MVSLSDAMVKAGQKIKLECEAEGIPIPKLIWTHDGKLIEETKYQKVRRGIFLFVHLGKRFNHSFNI